MTTLKCYHDAMRVLWSWFKDNLNNVTTLKYYYDAMWVRVWAMELVHRQCERGDDTKKNYVTMPTCGCRFGLWSWFTDNVDEVMTLKCNHDDMWVQVWAVELVHGRCGRRGDQM